MTGSNPTWAEWVDASCRTVEAAGQWRRPRTFDAAGPAGILCDPGAPPGHGRDVVSFASNDYLGLSNHPAVVAAAHRAIDRWGAGSGASRLVTGSRPVHAELESALAEWKGCERSIVTSTGFAANLSVLSVFATEGSHVFSDALNHASIVDGCRLARAAVTVYRHSDLGHLDELLRSATGRPVVVTDTVFSMDGDCADLAGLVEVCRRHGALLVLDEAHAVLGPEIEMTDRQPFAVEILRMGTLSKALGSLGGFVAGSRRCIELLENRARPYIFTTALSPADAAAALEALRVVRSGEGDLLRARLVDLVGRVSSGLGRQPQRSPIVPVVLGAEGHAVEAAARLLELGLWVPAIRPPTVPPGTSRIRVTLSASHTDQQVDRLIDGLGSIGAAPGPDRLRPIDGQVPVAARRAEAVVSGRPGLSDAS